MKQKAFTLLETIIVLSIITMFFAISIPLFSRLAASAKVDTSARNIASALRTARAHAISTNQDCEVRFDYPNTGDYHIFGSTPTGTGIIEKVYHLATGIAFANIGFTLETAGYRRARFTSTGMLDEDIDEDIDGDIDVQTADGSESITINVERTTGRVRIID